MFRRRGLLIAVLCAAAGAAAGIAGTAASPKHRAADAPRPGHMRDFRGPGHFRGGPPVHVEAVVLNRAGDKFITVTSDNGKLKSVSGNDLTITEAAGGVNYKDVTVTVPDDAKVSRNWADAKLGDLKEGDFVHVDSSSDGTFVFAVDPSARPPRPDFGRHGGPPPGGPEHGMRRGWGPPPGGPERGMRRGW